jgi:hypothetical protein
MDGSFVHWNVFIAGVGGSHIRVKERKDTFGWFTTCSFTTVVGVVIPARTVSEGVHLHFRVLGIESNSITAH